MTTLVGFPPCFSWFLSLNFFVKSFLESCALSYNLTVSSLEYGNLVPFYLKCSSVAGRRSVKILSGPSIPVPTETTLIIVTLITPLVKTK